MKRVNVKITITRQYDVEDLDDLIDAVENDGFGGEDIVVETVEEIGEEK